VSAPTTENVDLFQEDRGKAWEKIKVLLGIE
jgi:hypothetical protein